MKVQAVSERWDTIYNVVYEKYAKKRKRKKAVPVPPNIMHRVNVIKPGYSEREWQNLTRSPLWDSFLL